MERWEDVTHTKHHNEVDTVHGVFIMVAAIWIGTTKTFMTTITSRVVHISIVVCTCGICGHIMTICRLLIGRSFHFKVLIVFEIFYTYKIKGEKNISWCIEYNFWDTPFAQINVAYMHIVYKCCIFEDFNEKMMFF